MMAFVEQIAVTRPPSPRRISGRCVWSASTTARFSTSPRPATARCFFSKLLDASAQSRTRVYVDLEEAPAAS